MEGRPGPLAKFLAVASGLFCVAAAVTVTFSHVLGIFVAVLMVCAWFYFVRLLNFLSSSDEIVSFEGDEPTAKVSPASLSSEEIVRRLVQNTERIRRREASGITRRQDSAPTDRILRPFEATVPESALAKAVREGRISQPRDDGADKREEQEWADMFRAL